jgi:tetratricopeptide (TPR) repeat protein
MSIVKSYYKQTKRRIHTRLTSSLIGDDLASRAQLLESQGNLKKAAKLYLKIDLSDRAAPLFEALADDASRKYSKRLKDYFHAIQLHQDPPTRLRCAQKAASLPDLDPRDAAALAALFSDLQLWSLAGPLLEHLGDLDAAALAYEQAQDPDSRSRILDLQRSLPSLPPPQSPPSLAQKITQKVTRKLTQKPSKPPKPSPASPSPSSPPEPSPASFRLRLEQLISMRDLNLVSPDEFEAKRLEILADI